MSDELPKNIMNLQSGDLSATFTDFLNDEWKALFKTFDFKKGDSIDGYLNPMDQLFLMNSVTELAISLKSSKGNFANLLDVEGRNFLQSTWDVFVDETMKNQLEIYLSSEGINLLNFQSNQSTFKAFENIGKNENIDVDNIDVIASREKRPVQAYFVRLTNSGKGIISSNIRISGEVPKTKQFYGFCHLPDEFLDKKWEVGDELPYVITGIPVYNKEGDKLSCLFWAVSKGNYDYLNDHDYKGPLYFLKFTTSKRGLITSSKIADTDGKWPKGTLFGYTAIDPIVADRMGLVRGDELPLTLTKKPVVKNDGSESIPDMYWAH